MKIQIFYPKGVSGGGAHNGIYWPLTTLNIASFIKHRRGDVDIDIWDGELYQDNQTLANKLDPKTNIVGISATSFNYPNALEIARISKENGSTTVLGGLHPTYFKSEILRKRPYIDYVIYGKGENAFLQLLSQGNSAPNLIWRDGNQIKENPFGKVISLDGLPLLDYSLLEIEKYKANHKKIYPDFPDKPMSVMTHEGCAKREKFGPCSFCSIKTPLYFRDPTNFWREVERGVLDYGFNMVKDWGDSLTGNKPYIEQLLETRPESLKDLEFSVYNSLADIDERTLDLLRRLNVKMLFAAVESANDGILRRMNKGITKYKMKKAIELIARHNIPIFTSYVLGERGETIQSLEETLSFAKEIRSISNVRVSNGSPMVPLPGSPNFEMLVKIYPKLRTDDLFDLRNIKELWTRVFCPDLPDYDIVENYAEEIGKQGDMPNRYGWDLKNEG